MRGYLPLATLALIALLAACAAQSHYVLHATGIEEVERESHTWVGLSLTTR